MGALHEGHLSLIRRARRHNDLAIVTIFVNPAQFGPNEDLDRYPRALQRDIDLCEAEGVDIVFTPDSSEMYPPGYQTYVEPGALAEHLCARSRPGHFRGVATVVLKLFNLTLPSRAYFGMKDYQQLRIIQQMVADLNLPLEIVGMPTVREADGLALSSRNAYLSPEERRSALTLIRALRKSEQRWQSGERDPATLQQTALEALTAQPLVRVDYVEVLDADTLLPPTSRDAALIIAGAIYIGTTRLIDNIIVGA